MNLNRTRRIDLRNISRAASALAFFVVTATTDDVALLSAESLELAERGLIDLGHNAHLLGDADAGKFEFHLNRVWTEMAKRATVTV